MHQISGKNRYIFLEGKDKDYFYIDRSFLHIIPSNRFEPTLTKKPQKRHTGGYLNLLEDKDLIDREIYQEKKRRYILNSLTQKGEVFDIPQNYNLLFKKFLTSRKCKF